MLQMLFLAEAVTPFLGAPGPGRDIKMVRLIKMERILKESEGRHLLYEEQDHT